MHRLALAGFAVLVGCLGGCLREKVPFCDNGAFCPEPLVCTERTQEPFCGRATEVEPCMGEPEEAACTLPGDVKGFCETGICRACDPNIAACVYPAWVAMLTPSSQDLYAVWVAGPRDVYAAGRGGAFIHWDGRTWTQLPSPVGGGDLRAMAGASATDIQAASATSVFHFDGTAWSAAMSAPQPVFALWGAGPGDFFASGFQAMTGRTTGTAWTFATMTAGLSTSLQGLHGTGPNDVYAVGANGTVLHWTGSWAPQTTGVTYSLLGVFAVSANRVFAVGRTGANAPVMLQYTNAWTDITPAIPSELQSPATVLRGVFATATHAYVVGDNGKIIQSNGGPWEVMPTGTTVVLNAVGGSGSDVFAVGNEGKVLRYRIP